ncbi:hypothetical protein AJ79_00694 [Helicocarpus griseus UAMH5409]|uniref:Sialidase n=1 Tax=Helicocarpus griseus UAMH5409 TaxID=1447875 RepID=A0A2B7YBU9_9EURO|nr:hypothetical protein AJ79_00694 [Helicocarpus griseus UAMH5409]
MSLESYYYRPSTPPAMLAAGQYAGNSNNNNYLDNNTLHVHGDSTSSNNSSPDSALTNLTTPSLSPVVRQHGPALLPKIRPQDLVVEPVSSSRPVRHRKALSTARNPPGYAPYPASRSQARGAALASPIDCSLISPISTSSMIGSRAPSTLSSPVTLTPSHTSRLSGGGHSRSGSAGSIDERTLARYGYPTYRQLPKYMSQYSPTTPVSATAFLFPTYPPFHEPIASQPDPSPLPQPSPYFYPEPPMTSLAPPMPPAATSSYSDSDDLDSSTTLLDYLTGPTQAINLVRNVTLPLGRGQQQHFWWDIRNLRSWSDFSISTIHSIPSFPTLLTTQVPLDRLPPFTVPSTRLSPGSEGSLAELIRDIYAPRVNAAVQVSLGRHSNLHLKPTPEAFFPGNRNNSGPHFIASYSNEMDRTAAGTQRGRIVGLIKSFDAWNSGMRNEQPHKRVEYLNGLAHLQRCMRDHSCRYGFIMTEIELVCVRAGCDPGDDVPYFGYLEVAPPIPTNLSAASYSPPTPPHSNGSQNMTRSPSAQSSDYSPSPSSRSASPANNTQSNNKNSHPQTPLTASLALWYLVMLSKSTPLPTQPSWHLNVGGPGALTRQRVLAEGKDKWIPEPQTGEKRDAKRIRGWVWPQDPWHRREGGGGRGAKAAQQAQAQMQVGKGKRWHK